MSALFSDTDHLKSLKDYMRWAASRFLQAELSFGHGMASAFDEAVYLVLRAVHLPIDTPSIYWDAILTPSEREQVLSLLMQRINERKPAAYLTNEAWFASLPFYVNESVLVPRSPLAELIENQCSPWLDPEDVTQVLDLCTGSGCIGIACAYAFPQAMIDLSDISADALAVAKTNIERHGLTEQVNAYQSDLFQQLEPKSYDLIISNPPYVDAEDMAVLSDEFKHEPALGLAAGQDGLSIAHRILQEAANYLADDGVLIVEVGNSQYALQEAYPYVPFQWLSFERGGDGVFLLTKAQLVEYFVAPSE
jgi:ribosomal protein L3 glutamine methyltransferase